MSTKFPPIKQDKPRNIIPISESDSSSEQSSDRYFKQDEDCAGVSQIDVKRKPRDLNDSQYPLTNTHNHQLDNVNFQNTGLIGSQHINIYNIYHPYSSNNPSD